MTTVTVKFFGPARDATGVASAEYQLVEPATLGTLREMVLAQYAGLASAAASLRFAVNQDYVDTDVALSDGDEVAVIPPVAGGSPSSDDGTVAIVERPIELAPLVQLAAAHESLGYCFFRTRDFDAATRSYMQALAYDWRLSKAHAGLGSINMLRFLEDDALTDRRDRALEHWHRSLEIKPDQARIRKLIARYHPTRVDPEQTLLVEHVGP